MVHTIKARKGRIPPALRDWVRMNSKQREKYHEKRKVMYGPTRKDYEAGRAAIKKAKAARRHAPNTEGVKKLYGKTPSPYNKGEKPYRAELRSDSEVAREKKWEGRKEKARAAAGRAYKWSQKGVGKRINTSRAYSQLPNRNPTESVIGRMW